MTEEHMKLRAEVERLVGLQKEIEIEKRGMAYDIHKLREAIKWALEQTAFPIDYNVRISLKKALEEQPDD